MSGWIAVTGGVLGVLFLSLWKLVSRYDHGDYTKKKRQAAIILGAALNGTEPSPALLERLDHAEQLYREGWVTRLILSGGSPNRQDSEASVMKKSLIQRGIPEEALLLEDQSTNTAENLLLTRKVMEQHDITDAYLVTHDYHMFRALGYAKRAGLDLAPAPFHSRTLWMPYHKARECLALIKYALWRK
ncbi:hypothetical protein GCM10011571_08110 [Marinithermofilum abyssi]|uniref:DUF218 domain-containing protein n=1 Tax=Marinithermofilum abyssi TaxID=1571185 RepID=A0A8J2YCK9_9BACL|nr:YdcF family protein [Marinithermofilum abyssi]GGE09145.1 hypothetical protein GCM10011571_08110 [Marinithermofilum abyssi]